MTRQRRKTLVLLTVLAFLFAGCSAPGPISTPAASVLASPSASPSPTPTLTPSPTPTATPVPTPEPPARVTVAAVGDLMCHKYMVYDAFDRESQSYDFDSMLADIAPFLSAADITTGNLETPVAGADYGYTGSSGKLNFNAPDSYLDMLRLAGFDVLTNANNHMLDKGWQGLLNTLDALDQWGFVHTGGFRNQEENEAPCIVEHDGIRIAFVTATGVMNVGKGSVPEENRPWVYNEPDIDKLTADIARARAAGADLVFACIHWGSERTQKPSSFQRKLAEQLVAAGADCILGCHPHVVQPIERVEAGGRTGLVFYSLGNFISNMYPPQADTGIIAYITYEKDRLTGQMTLTDAAYLPAIVWKKTYQGEGNWDFRVLPMARYLEDESLFSTLDSAMKKRMTASYEETLSFLGDEAARPVADYPG